MFKSYFHNISSIQRTFIIVLIFVVSTILLVYYTSDTVTTLFISFIICIILFITKGVWTPYQSSKNSIRIASIGLALATIQSFGFWQNYTSQIISVFIEKTFSIKVPPTEDKVLSYGLLVFVLTVICVVNYFSRDISGMGQHPDSIDKDIPDRDYNDKLDGIVAVLKDYLNGINIKTNWNNQFFVPLKAEVEISNNNKRRRHITDILKAIRRSDDRLFLVLGEPGSGKSVALRKLCYDLLDETKKTGKIPVYINLKEWE